MLLTEFDEAAYAKTLREEGMKKGEARLSKLIFQLISEKRFNDLEKVTKDSRFEYVKVFL